ILVDQGFLSPPGGFAVPCSWSGADFEVEERLLLAEPPRETKFSVRDGPRRRPSARNDGSGIRVKMTVRWRCSDFAVNALKDPRRRKRSVGAPVLLLKNVTVMRGDHAALREVNLEIAAGEHVCILGPNGWGKSTLIKTITRECYPLAQDGCAMAILGRERW